MTFTQSLSINALPIAQRCTRSAGVTVKSRAFASIQHALPHLATKAQLHHFFHQTIAT